MSTIGFIGGGNMAQALVEGILKAGLVPPGDIIVSDISVSRLEFLEKSCRVRIAADNAALAGTADVVILAVKPQQADGVLTEIAGRLKPGALVISIAAGITTGRILGVLGLVQVVRVMPNTPALVGQGASAMFSANASKENLALADKLFSSVGLVLTVPREDLMDAVTAVSGSGPAYFFLLMEQLIEAGVRLGLSRQAATKLVIQTARGAAELAVSAAEKNETPTELRKKVTSPGGTTEAAIRVFEEHNFAAVVLHALTAACQRSKQLSTQ